MGRQSVKVIQVNFRLRCRLPHASYSYVRGTGGLSRARSTKISAALTGLFLLSGQKFAMLEMKATISAMLRHYKLSLDDPNETLRFILELVMKSPSGTRLKLESRAWSAPGPQNSPSAPSAAFQRLAYLTRHLSLTDTCHVLDIVHFCKYWSLVHIPEFVGVCHTGQRNCQCRKNELHLLIQPFKAQWSLYVPPVVTICTANGHYMYCQFNIQQFYVLPTHCIYVLCGSQNKQRLFPYTALTDWFV